MGKLGSTSSPPIQEMGSWGRQQMSADYTPTQPQLPHDTTYRDEGLVGKRACSTSPPPIQMTGSWGSSPRRPLVTPPSQPDFPTTYREEGLVGKQPLTSLPPIQKRGSWGSCAKRPLIIPSRPRRAGTPSPRVPWPQVRAPARGPTPPPPPHLPLHARVVGSARGRAAGGAERCPLVDVLCRWH